MALERRKPAERPTGRLLARILQVSLHDQIKLARLWLPLAIAGVVLLHQLALLPVMDRPWAFWAQLLFYGILGPTVTFITLTWIASEVRQREAAQQELSGLYEELSSSHRLLAAIQNVTEQFASATDLAATLRAGSRGLTEVSRALGAAVFIRAGGASVAESHGLDAALLAHAAEQDAALRRGESSGERQTIAGQDCWLLSAPLVWSGRLEGSVHAYYRAAPGNEQRESFNLVVAELSAAAEAARSRTRDLLTLVEVDRSIRAEGNLERLLETLLTQMMERADASLGGVYLADEAGLLQLGVTRDAANGTSRQPLRLGEGFVGRVGQAARAQVVHRLSDEERASPCGLLRRAGSAVALPLLSDEGLLGVVVLAHEQAGHFSEAALPFLDLVAGQVSLAVSNARAYLQSEELAIAEERARIAREIHDGVAQTLALSALKLDLVSRLLGSDPAKAEAELRTTRHTLRETIKEVRRSIFALRPIDLERHGFAETVRRYCTDYGEQNGVRVALEASGMPRLSPKSEAVLFRIFQEAMNNVAKHASAREVVVALGERGGQGFISVADDGQGFDLSAVSDRVTSAGGLGLRHMRERVEGRGGRFELRSAPGAGTTVFASVPE